MYFVNEDKRTKDRLFKRIGREFEFAKVMPTAALQDQEEELRDYGKEPANKLINFSNGSLKLSYKSDLSIHSDMTSGMEDAKQSKQNQNAPTVKGAKPAKLSEPQSPDATVKLEEKLKQKRKKQGPVEKYVPPPVKEINFHPVQNLEGAKESEIVTSESDYDHTAEAAGYTHFQAQKIKS